MRPIAVALRLFLIASIAAAALVVVPLSGRPAAAEHLAGGYYLGTTATGGTVEFAVSTSGTLIVHMTISADPATDSRCGMTVRVLSPGQGIPIINHSFTASSPSAGMAAAGSFARGGMASGTLIASQSSTCPSAVNTTWTATSRLVRITPNSPYVSGANPIVVEGDTTARAVWGRVVDESRRQVQALWMLRDGLWRYQTFTVDGGLRTFPGPVSTAFVILE